MSHFSGQMAQRGGLSRKSGMLIDAIEVVPAGPVQFLPRTRLGEKKKTEDVSEVYLVLQQKPLRFSRPIRNC